MSRHSGKRVGFIAASATAVLAIPLLAIYAADASTDSLLSQGRSATASSVETSTLGAAKAFDGDSRTRWGSQEGIDPQWLKVDLGAVRRITRAKLTWERAYAKTYRIEVSTDSTTWKTIYSTAAGNGGTDDLTNLSGKGRYLRLTGTARGTTWGYSLWELKVYGSSNATPIPTTTASSGTETPTAQPSASSASSTARPTSTAPSTPAQPAPTGTGGVDLTDPAKKDIAMQLVSSAENSSLDWKAQYKYIEDIGDGRGYTAGIIGFCSGTGDMLDLVELLHRRKPGQRAGQVPARAAQGQRHRLARRPRPGFPADWRTAATGHRRSSRPRTTSATGSTSTRPSAQGKTDGLRALGQFIYYDAIVMHGDGERRGQLRRHPGDAP